MSAKYRKTVNLTEAQDKLASQLYEQAGFNSFSAWLKHLLEVEALQNGYLWPDDESTWGDPNRLPNYKK